VCFGLTKLTVSVQIETAFSVSPERELNFPVRTAVCEALGGSPLG